MGVGPVAADWTVSRFSNNSPEENEIQYQKAGVEDTSVKLSRRERDSVSKVWNGSYFSKTVKKRTRFGINSL